MNENTCFLPQPAAAQCTLWDDSFSQDRKWKNRHGKRVVSQFSHKNAAISIMYNQLYIIILLALSLTTLSDSGCSSIPLGHRPGSDQPWLGRLEEGVCCKTRNTQLLKVTTQMMCPSLCISCCFINWKLWEWEYQWQPGTDWVTTMKSVVTSGERGQPERQRTGVERVGSPNHFFREEEPKATDWWNLQGGFNPSRQSEMFVPSSNDDATQKIPDFWSDEGGARQPTVPTASWCCQHQLQHLY